ncbi:MAG TPA: hypothetical protein VIM65_06835 [Cyclobacteriaceae bacterium]
MKTNTLFGKVTGFVAIALVGLVVSCKDNDRLSGSDATNATSESLTDSYYDDSDDMAVNASDYASTARMATGYYDYRFCANPTLSGDTVWLEFNTVSGCIDKRGNVRKGTIRIIHTGGTPRTVGFKATITYLNYSINGIKLEGTRVIECVTPSANDVYDHTINLTDGKATWLSDGSTATRAASFTREVNTADTTITILSGGQASGINRSGKSYTMDIIKSIVFKPSCAAINQIHLPVQGTKLFKNTTTGKTLTIDYGNGDCDRSMTITVGRVSFNYTVNK